jgi:hypothetical protein
MPAPFPFQNGLCPFLSSPRNGSIEELHSPLVVSPPRHHLPYLHLHIKGAVSLTIYRLIHSPPYFRFLLHKNSLSPELKSLPLPLLAAWLCLSLHRPELQLVRSSGSSSSSSSIHGELLCITAAMRSNSSEFLSSQVHRAPNASHSLQYLHPLHSISHTKINPNYRKNSRILHQHPCFFLRNYVPISNSE